MHIATVIPISRGIPFDTLTYYVSERLAPGTLVTVPLGRQTIYGFVTETVPLTEAKVFVKRAAFSLKKISSIIGHIPFYEAAVGALKDTGTAAVAPIGAVSASVIPELSFEYITGEKLQQLLAKSTAGAASTLDEASIAGTHTERADEYKRMIRSSFAAKRSVLFVAPTIRALESWRQVLERGIARHVVVFHGKVNKKTLRTQFAMLKNDSTPLVVFATPGFSLLPIPNLGSIIVEDESSTLYKSHDRYEIDARIFLKQFAARIGASLRWGDTLPRFETLWRTKNDHFSRTYVPDKLTVVPIEPYRTILPGEVIELIRHAEKKKRRLFIYTNRKGVAPLSRCADCGTVVECPDCGLPITLRNKVVRNTTGGFGTGTQTERVFVCSHCSGTLPSDHVCTHCQSWNIVPVAIGTESVRDAIAQIVGIEAVVTIDDDLTPDSKEIETLLQQTDKQKFVVFVGTHKALPYLRQIEYCIIPFFDRLLSLPSLYTVEYVLRLIMECNEIAQRGVIVCSKTPDFPFTRQIEMHKINAIIHDELELRRTLGYPPFGTLLKISLTVPEGFRQHVRERVDEYIRNLDATMLPPRRVSIGGMKVLLVWLIKVPNDYIEEEGGELSLFLESLHFPFRLEQNPERL